VPIRDGVGGGVDPLVAAIGIRMAVGGGVADLVWTGRTDSETVGRGLGDCDRNARHSALDRRELEAAQKRGKDSLSEKALTAAEGQRIKAGDGKDMGRVEVADGARIAEIVRVL